MASRTAFGISLGVLWSWAGRHWTARLFQPFAVRNATISLASAPQAIIRDVGASICTASPGLKLLSAQHDAVQLAPLLFQRQPPRLDNRHRHPPPDRKLHLMERHQP